MNGSFLVKTPLFKTYIYLNLKNQLIPVRIFLTAHEVNRPIPKTISKFSEKNQNEFIIYDFYACLQNILRFIYNPPLWPLGQFTALILESWRNRSCGQVIFFFFFWEREREREREGRGLFTHFQNIWNVWSEEMICLK